MNIHGVMTSSWNLFIHYKAQIVKDEFVEWMIVVSLYEWTRVICDKLGPIVPYTVQ